MIIDFANLFDKLSQVVTSFVINRTINYFFPIFKALEKIDKPASYQPVVVSKTEIPTLRPALRACVYV